MFSVIGVTSIVFVKRISHRTESVKVINIIWLDQAM